MSKLSSKVLGMRFMQRAVEKSQAKIQEAEQAEQADRRQGEASELAKDAANVG